MKVWVVLGEYVESKSGEVAWIDGVFTSEALALEKTQESSLLEYPDSRVLIDGRPYGNAWECECEDKPNHSEFCTGEDYDWEVSYSIEEREVEE